MSPLADRDCIPCRGGVPTLPADQQQRLLEELGGDWRIVDGHHLAREFRFADFADALRFVNLVAAEAEAQGHHPDLHLAWGKVGIEIWTHKIDGLHESDFILAAKCDRILDTHWT